MKNPTGLNPILSLIVGLLLGMMCLWFVFIIIYNISRLHQLGITLVFWLVTAVGSGAAAIGLIMNYVTARREGKYERER